jgi:hypothetical protein
MDYIAAFSPVHQEAAMDNEYDTYVIRVWPYDDKRQQQKIMLENPHTGSKVRFHNWNDLVAFLQTKRASLGRDSQSGRAKTS